MYLLLACELDQVDHGQVAKVYIHIDSSFVGCEAVDDPFTCGQQFCKFEVGSRTLGRGDDIHCCQLERPILFYTITERRIVTWHLGQWRARHCQAYIAWAESHNITSSNPHMPSRFCLCLCFCFLSPQIIYAIIYVNQQLSTVRSCLITIQPISDSSVAFAHESDGTRSTPLGCQCMVHGNGKMRRGDTAMYNTYY